MATSEQIIYLGIKTLHLMLLRFDTATKKVFGFRAWQHFNVLGAARVNWSVARRSFHVVRAEDVPRALLLI